MGGSGGGRNFSGSADTAWNPAGLAESVERTRQLQDRVELEQLFDETVGRINQFDTEEMVQHKQTILNALRDEFEGLTDLQGGGSRTRHTYVDGLSDVDFLADLGPYSQSSVPSKNDSAAVIAAMADRIQRRLPLTEVTPGRMAVTIRFADGHELQVLPAFRYHSGYRVPDAEGSGWVLTRPSVFAQLLRERNADTGGRLLRIIKLGKLMCAKADVGIKSYHLENIAVRAFERYNGEQTDASMLRHLFNQTKRLVGQPIRDVTGQNTYVDGYLTSQAERMALARGLASLETRIAAAGEQPDKWRPLLD